MGTPLERVMPDLNIMYSLLRYISPERITDKSKLESITAVQLLLDSHHDWEYYRYIQISPVHNRDTILLRQREKRKHSSMYAKVYGATLGLTNKSRLSKYQPTRLFICILRYWKTYAEYEKKKATTLGEEYNNEETVRKILKFFNTPAFAFFLLRYGGLVGYFFLACFYD